MCFIKKKSGSAVVSHMYLTDHHHSACAESKPPSFNKQNQSTQLHLCCLFDSMTPTPPHNKDGDLSPILNAL